MHRRTFPRHPRKEVTAWVGDTDGAACLGRRGVVVHPRLEVAAWGSVVEPRVQRALQPWCSPAGGVTGTSRARDGGRGGDDDGGSKMGVELNKQALWANPAVHENRLSRINRTPLYARPGREK